MGSEWHDVYDLLDFVPQMLQGKRKADYIQDCNRILERELSGYRFVDDRLINCIPLQWLSS